MDFKTRKGSTDININISNNELKSLNGLANLKDKNSYLHAASNKLESIDGLSHFKAMDALYLYNNTKLKNISGLSNLERINFLTLNNCFLESVKPLANLRYCEYLSLINNNLVNVDGLEGLQRITDLDLSLNKELNDLSGLRNLVSVDTLALNTNNLTPEDLSKLENLKIVNYLVFKNQLTPVTNVRYKVVSVLKTKKIPIQNTPIITID